MNHQQKTQNKWELANNTESNKSDWESDRNAILQCSTQKCKLTEQLGETNLPSKHSKGLLYIDKTNIMIYLNEFNNLHTEIMADPLLYKEAISRNDCKLWNKAMNDKVQQLIHSNTWEIVYPPNNTNVIGTQFVYKTKHLADNSIEKQKARLVVQGIYQQDSKDYCNNNLFVLTTHISLIRLTIVWECLKNYKIH